MRDNDKRKVREGTCRQAYRCVHMVQEERIPNIKHLSPPHPTLPHTIIFMHKGIHTTIPQHAHTDHCFKNTHVCKLSAPLMHSGYWQ